MGVGGEHVFSYIHQLVLIICSVDKQCIYPFMVVNCQTIRERLKRSCIFSSDFKASHPAPFFVDFIILWLESFKEVMMINNKNKQTSLRTAISQLSHTV